MNQHDHNSDLSRTVFIILEPFDSKYATQFLTRLHAGAAPAKNEEGGGDIISHFLAVHCYSLLLFKTFKFTFWIMTRYFPLFLKKRGLTVKERAKWGKCPLKRATLF